MTTAITLALCFLFALAFTAAWPMLGRLDNELGGDMTDPSHGIWATTEPVSRPASLRDRIRRYLGTDNPRMENTMATMLELLTGLTAKTTEASAAQQASFLNLHNAVDKLTTNVARLEQLVRDGEASEELQTLATQISENLGDMKKAADTADDGFEPVEAPPVETPGGDVPPADQPVEDGTPVEPGNEVPPTDGSTSRRR